MDFNWSGLFSFLIGKKKGIQHAFSKYSIKLKTYLSGYKKYQNNDKKYVAKICDLISVYNA